MDFLKNISNNLYSYINLKNVLKISTNDNCKIFRLNINKNKSSFILLTPTPLISSFNDLLMFSTLLFWILQFKGSTKLIL
jgi:hypothetical protein